MKQHAVIDDLEFSKYSRSLLPILRSVSVIRPFAYASEVGESLRPVIPRSVVKALYGLSLAYVGADIAVKTHDLWLAKASSSRIAKNVLDLGIFHACASMIFPAVTIHSIVKYTGKVMPKITSNKSVAQWTPAIFGLFSIPFIIHPIDHFTDWMMNHTVRKVIDINNEDTCSVPWAISKESS
jgi:fission process protein 1